MDTVPYYQRLSRAADLENLRERRIYRALEMLPGVLTWGTFVVGAIGAWLFPVWVAIIILVFVMFWLYRVIYLSFHLVSAYRRMRRYEKVDWVERLKRLKEHSLPVSDWRDVYHIVVVPYFEEPLEVLRPTVESIKNTDYPKDRIILVLAAEEGAGEEAKRTAETLVEEYKDVFFRVEMTLHPANLPGEVPGKASNETWALKRTKENVLEELSIPVERVFVTSLDADTVLSPHYFSRLTYVILTTHDPLHASYQPIPLFLNNVWESPAISRVFSFNSTFWHTMNQQRPEKLISFSSHTISLKALLDVDFKLPNVVSDDSRIFWQCFLMYDGNYRTEPLFCSVSMDANAAPTLWQTIKNIYKQQRRWAYGVADVPYFLFGFIKNNKIPLNQKLSVGGEMLFGFWSWATASVLIFGLGWLPIVIGGEAFTQTMASYNLPRFISILLRFAMVGVIGSMFLTLLLVPAQVPYGRRKRSLLVLQWFLLPFTMVVASFPAIEAQTRLMVGKYLGFWPTPKWRKGK